MVFERFEIDGPLLILPKRHEDVRGWFSETFRSDKFCLAAGDFRFVQHNQSMSAAQGTVRGLHFQAQSMAQGKLMRCLHGGIIDIAVDIRRSSPTFGRHVAVELTESNGNQFWVPPGFAHGFVTRVANTQVSYLVTEYYSPGHERGLLWCDPTLAIDWGVSKDRAILSERDRKWPTLSDMKDVFE